MKEIEAEPIEVIYEKGVLRPVRPLDLAEGTRLEVTVTGVTETETPTTSTAPSTKQEQDEEAEVDEETYAAFLNKLDSIAALPLQSAPQAHTVRDHDAILYPKQGTMP